MKISNDGGCGFLEYVAGIEDFQTQQINLWIQVFDDDFEIVKKKEACKNTLMFLQVSNIFNKKK